MARDFLPRQDVQIADPSGRTTTPFYVWMQSLERAFGALDVDLAALLEQIEQLKPGQQLAFEGAMSVTVTNVDGTITISLDGDNDSPGGNWYYGTNADGVRGFWPVADGVSGGYSITKAVDYGPYNYQGELDTPDELPYPVVVGDAYLINGDLWVGADDGGDDGAGWDNLGPPPTTTVLSLVNDESMPDPTSYYGTNAAGDKGWHAASDTMEAAPGELTKSVDSDGVTTFGLPDIPPESGGTLQRYGFDDKGRRVEEEAADTDDLAEGSSNLYFTDERAQDAAGAVLDDSGDVELRYETSPARRIWATLSSAVQSALSAAVSALQPGDNVSELVNDAGYTTNAGTVTSVGLSVPTGLTVSGSPITSSGTITVNYDTGYQGYTSAEAAKLSGIAAGATVGATWGTNLGSIPANIASWAAIAPSEKLNVAGDSMTGNLVAASSAWRIVTNTSSGSDSSSVSISSSSALSNTRGANIQLYGANHETLPGFVLINSSAGADIRLNPSIGGAVAPSSDNSRSCGSGSLRWSEIYAATGTINTSDERLKSNIRELSETELACASDLAALPKIYQFNDALAEKGHAARLHCSPTVQSVIAVMQSHGLDPFRYGFVCYDEWEEQAEIRDEETGEIIQEHRAAGERYSLRPDELHFFIARGQEERLRRIEQALGL